MTPVANQLTEKSTVNRVRWSNLLWFGALLMGCYAPVLARLVRQWSTDDDMGHGFFVPLLAGYIAWQKRNELQRADLRTNYWGLLLLGWGILQMLIGSFMTK